MDPAGLPDKAWTWALVVVAAVCWLARIFFNLKGREGWSFIFSAITLVGAVAFLFSVLYPNVMPSSIDSAYNLTIHNASSTPYTLKIMTIVAVIFTPIVLAYQSWTYWVFRKRVSRRTSPTRRPGRWTTRTRRKLPQPLPPLQVLPDCTCSQVAAPARPVPAPMSHDASGRLASCPARAGSLTRQVAPDRPTAPGGHPSGGPGCRRSPDCLVDRTNASGARFAAQPAHRKRA